ncbi:MAG TPA: UDP-N-acetylmuramate--L-alanine ligase [Gemmatimonadaceae bacterium]
MPLLDSSDPRPVHFVGIAGAGMSALAELFIRRGVAVTGCDAHPEAAGDLRQLGLDVTTHDPAHAATARALVVTSAMPKDHPELARARALGIPVIRRADALGEVTAGRELVGVAGTHGKTTTTIMVSTVLAAAGRDPTALVGGRVAAWEGNLRAGGDRLYVVEADEYDRSFLALSPTVAVVTNIEADHLDIYADLADIQRAFAQFVHDARAIALCGDDPGASALRVPSTAEVVRYGIESGDARLRARGVVQSGGSSAFDVVFDDEMLGRAELCVPGRHNILNSLAALAAGLLLGASFDAMAPSLTTFAGAERRFQRLGEARGVLVVDDYAHHPTEIAATLAAARAAFPGRRVVAAFQPHLFTRTRDFARQFGEVLSAADAVFLTEIYAAREQPIPGVTARVVADALTACGGRLEWIGERGALADALVASVGEGDVVLTIGAGDITRTGPELLQRLET